MKKLKKILSVILTVLMVSTLSISVFAAPAGDPYSTTYEVKITPSNTSITKGSTVSIALTAAMGDEDSIDIAKSKYDVNWSFKLDYDNTAFEYVSINVNYGLTETSMSKDLGSQYNFEASMSSDSVSILKDTPIAVLTFKAKDDLTNFGKKTFNLSSISMIDDNWCGIDASGLEMPKIAYVTVTDSTPVPTPTYPNMKEETFTEAGEVNGIPVTSESKVWTVFHKTATSLDKNTYGLKVVNDGKTYTFPGLSDVKIEDGKSEALWAIKIVAPTQKFADNVDFAPTSIKAYVGTTLSGELIK